MRRLISEYHDDELSDEERQTVEHHILICGECYKEFAEMGALTRRLKRALRPYRFTAEDKQALLDRLARKAW
jgi:anti-sigma factor RsiW